MEQPEYLLKTLLSHVLPVAMDLRTLSSLNGTTIPTLYQNASFTVDVRPWVHARGIIGAGEQGRSRRKSERPEASSSACRSASWKKQEYLVLDVLHGVLHMHVATGSYLNTYAHSHCWLLRLLAGHVWHHPAARQRPGSVDTDRQPRPGSWSLLHPSHQHSDLPNGRIQACFRLPTLCWWGLQHECSN